MSSSARIYSALEFATTSLASGLLVWFVQQPANLRLMLLA
jgi:hypothetical protein